MEQKPNLNLEAAIRRELKALPNRRAPSGLLPSVMAAIQARAALPWYRKPWQQWPRGLQMISVTLGLIVVFGLAGSAGWAWLTWVAAPVESARAIVLACFHLLWSITDALGSAMSVWVRSANTSVWIGIGSVVGVSYAMCVGAGTVVYHYLKVRQ